MKCYVCGKPLKTGQRVIPSFVLMDSTRYDAVVPTASPQYAHARHFARLEGGGVSA